MKKIISLSLTVVMLLAMVQIPASAENTELFSASISCDDSEVFYDRAGRENTLYKGFAMDSDPTGNIYGELQRDASITKESVYTYDNGNKAIKITSENEDTIHVLSRYTPTSTSSTPYFQFSIKLMVEDMNCDRSLQVRAQYGEIYYEFITLKTDGKIYAGNTSLCDYSTNNWYKIDAYYCHNDGYWHVFVNDAYTKAVKNVTSGAFEFNGFQVKYISASGETTTTYVDDIVVNKMDTVDVATILPHYSAGFNYISAGRDIAKEDLKNESTNAFSYGVIKNDATTIKSAERTAGNKFIEFKQTSQNATKNFMYIENLAYSINDGNILHIGFDFKTDDFNCTKVIRLQTDNLDWSNFINFCDDGTIKFLDTRVENVISTYKTGTWYDIDTYYDKSSKMWYVFINDVLEAKTTLPNNSDFNKVILLYYSFVSKSASNISMCLDNIYLGKITKSELSNITAETIIGNVMTAVKNEVSPKSVLIKIKSPDALSGTIIAALYNGTELAELITTPASDIEYLKFTKDGDEAKIMWWNDIDDTISPVVESIDLSIGN